MKITENITNGSDTGKSGLWAELVVEATCNTHEEQETRFDEFVLSNIISWNSTTIIETLAGFGRNPFISGSAMGRLRHINST